VLTIYVTVPEKYEPVDMSVKSWLGSLLGGCKPLKGRAFEVSVNYADLVGRDFMVNAADTLAHLWRRGIGPRSIDHMNDAVRQALATVRHSCPSHFPR